MFAETLNSVVPSSGYIAEQPCQRKGHLKCMYVGRGLHHLKQMYLFALVKDH